MALVRAGMSFVPARSPASSPSRVSPPASWGAGLATASDYDDDNENPVAPSRMPPPASWGAGLAAASYDKQSKPPMLEGLGKLAPATFGVAGPPAAPADPSRALPPCCLSFPGHLSVCPCWVSFLLFAVCPCWVLAVCPCCLSLLGFVPAISQLPFYL